MGRTSCTEPQCLYKGALYLFTYTKSDSSVHRFQCLHRDLHCPIMFTTVLGDSRQSKHSRSSNSPWVGVRVLLFNVSKRTWSVEHCLSLIKIQSIERHICYIRINKTSFTVVLWIFIIYLRIKKALVILCITSRNTALPVVIKKTSCVPCNVQTEYIYLP